MHGELPKSDTHQRVRPSRARRLMSWLFVLLAAGAALYYVFFLMGSPVQRTAARPLCRQRYPVPVLVAQAATADVPVYLDCGRHDPGAQHRDGAFAGRRQVARPSISRKARTSRKATSSRASIRPPSRPRSIRRSQRRRRTRRNSPTPRSISSATSGWRRPTPSTASRPTRSVRWSRRYTALVQSDQAAIESAQATLGYTDIRAPIDGRTGIRQVDRRQHHPCVRCRRHRRHHADQADRGLFNLPQQDVAARQRRICQRRRCRPTRCAPTTTR